MKNSNLVFIGVVIFLLGFLLGSPIVQWLMNVIANLTMVLGIIIVGIGIYSAIRGKK